MASNTELRSAIINLRLQEQARELIDKAASALGKTRTEFMVDAARREAESVLLDRTYFALGEKEYKAFEAALNTSPADNPRLRRLLKTSAPWEG